MHTPASLFRPGWHLLQGALIPQGKVALLSWGLCPSQPSVLPARGSCRRQLVWGRPALMAALSGCEFLWKRRDSGDKIIPFLSKISPFPPLSPLFVGCQEMFALWPEGHEFRAAALCAQLWLAAALGNSSASIFPSSKLKLKGFCYIQATKQHLTLL